MNTNINVFLFLNLRHAITGVTGVQHTATSSEPATCVTKYSFTLPFPTVTLPIRMVGLGLRRCLEEICGKLGP